MNYYAVLTDHGAQLIEQAYQHGQVVTITQMAIGDGGGVELEPATSALAVAGEFDRVPLTSGASASSMLGGGVDYESQAHVGKWIRTLGLMDSQGNLIVYSNYPPTYIADKGSTLFRTLGLDIQLPIVHGDAVTVIVERPPYPPATTKEKGVVRLATDDEALLGTSIDAVMSAKNVADSVKNMLKQMFVGVPLPWMKAEPPAWGLNMTGQAINKLTDPILFERYPSGYLDDMRAMTIKGFDNGRGLDPNRQMLSFQPGSLAYGDDDWSSNAMFLSGLNQGNRAASSYGVPVPANYPNAKTGNVTATSTSGTPVNFNAAGVTQIDNKAFNYITMRG